MVQELLALGEQIGNANTGLSEEIITTKLKTRTFSLSATNIDMEETATLGQEPDVCIICQVVKILQLLTLFVLKA